MSLEHCCAVRQSSECRITHNPTQMLIHASVLLQFCLCIAKFRLSSEQSTLLRIHVTAQTLNPSQNDAGTNSRHQV